MSQSAVSGTSSQNQQKLHVALYPRCEYKQRFEGTSAFVMKIPKYWGQYHRSTKRGGNYGRLADTPKEDSLRPNKIKEVIPAKPTTRRSSSGLIDSPYKYHYNLRPRNDKRRQLNSSANTSDYFLYDDLLKYRNSM